MPPRPEPDAGPTHYEVLGVAHDADAPTIRRAYRAAMRRLHPDAGGASAGPTTGPTADELVAVQAAWRTLGDPASREAYDRTAGVLDDWDLGWGVALDEPDARPEAHPDPGPGRDPGPRPDPGPSDAAQPWLTPDAPGAVALPEPVLPEAPRGRDAVTRLLLLGAAVLAVAAVAGSVVTVETYGERRVEAAVLAAVAMLVCLVVLLDARQEAAGEPAKAAGYAISGLTLLGCLGLPSGIGWAPTGVALSLVGSLLAAVGARRRRLGRLRRAEAERAALLTAHLGARDWNRVRDALRTRGAQLERCFGPYNTADLRFMRTVDARTGEWVVRKTGQPYPRDTWLVVAPDGEVLCAAAPGARDAWVACWPQPAARR